MHGLVHEKGGIKTYFEGLDLDAIRAHLSWTGGQALISQLFKQAKLDGAVSTCTSLLRTCQHWLTIKPDDARICLATASALARLGRTAEARDTFTEALRLAALSDVSGTFETIVEKEMKTLGLEIVSRQPITLQTS